MSADDPSSRWELRFPYQRHRRCLLHQNRLADSWGQTPRVLCRSAGDIHKTLGRVQRVSIVQAGDFGRPLYESMNDEELFTKRGLKHHQSHP